MLRIFGKVFGWDFHITARAFSYSKTRVHTTPATTQKRRLSPPFFAVLTYIYAFPNALSTTSGVAGGFTHLPMALCSAIMTRCVFASEWLMPFAP